MKNIKTKVLTTAVIACLMCGCEMTQSNNEQMLSHTASSFQKANLSKDFIKGADISTLIEMEQAGFVYRNEKGEPEDCLKILRDNGIDYIRVRLWVDPKDQNGNLYGAGNNDLATDLELVRRAKKLGMKVLLDFHYSDFWTDPGKQFKPKSWENLSFEELNDAIYKYSKDVMSTFKDAGLTPEMVQIGNEVNSGILWPEGKSWGGDGHEFDRLSLLLKSAIKGVKEAVGSDSKIMLHLAKGPDNGAFKWWFDEITKRDVNFDVIGMSMYTWWDGPISALTDNIKWVKNQYGKDVMVVEGSYPYTLESDDSLAQDIDAEGVEKSGYEASVNGQYQYLKDLMENVDKAGGTGFFYWEAAWKTAPGISWASPAGMAYIKCGADCQQGNARENQALFDKSGKVLPSIKVFNN